MADLLVLLIGLVAGAVLLTVLVALLVVPPLRRFGRARARFAADWSARVSILRALGLERRLRR
ncbi:hypothetical protein ACQEVB_26900 [Pseudonocardia sp. CA-107938]|uniref:hypothetical protein n=1 Tax=Pseudonocardia sp. CA-107938 TaxID=3240021 RepID=UPI003D8A1504